MGEWGRVYLPEGSIMKIKARKYYEREYGKVNARRWNKRYPRRDNPDGT